MEFTSQCSVMPGGGVMVPTPVDVNKPRIIYPSTEVVTLGAVIEVVAVVAIAAEDLSTGLAASTPMYAAIPPAAACASGKVHA